MPLISGLLFLLIMFLGVWLSRKGKPYNVVVFTLHKLITLGTLAYLAVSIYKIHQASPLGTGQMIVVGVTAALFVITIVTGGLLSVDKAMPVIVLKLHQVMPFLTAISTSVMLYLVLA